ncbi:MAG: hypothetical protein IJQ77_07365 [Synergistaceae bacterium]|nr:hypothetical protein [Synergistaceae bacterium]MBR0250886.1 hypothetical protein [Synergistaceae bacterium]
MSKFTKGKWSVEYGIDIKSDIRDEAYIAQLYFLGERFEEQAANGRLIVAAPEMYELIREAAYLPGGQCPVKRKARELLARIDAEDHKHD